MVIGGIVAQINTPTLSENPLNFHFCRHWNPLFLSRSTFENEFLLSTQFSGDLSDHQDMDTSNPAVFVNAELLRLYVGRRVRALIQVVRTEGGTVIGKSTDENQLVALLMVKNPSMLTYGTTLERQLTQLLTISSVSLQTGILNTCSFELQQDCSANAKVLTSYILMGF
ncbi:replication protein A 14 kDa subunit B [Prunus yedoensis var. nudiflora]|uniref:Replication protein A 14 kDa subunit B n=1 Tax=Prunus yedoensis var. nudiflora TaxID=2094558 RepID=A0A314ZNH4_PRUYE|nr:replication protein A 14 kDa subunit B [Prunus yedoensis var. nudiflora]